MARKSAFFLVLLTSFYFLASSALAQEFSSTNFKVVDPVMFPGRYSTSTTFGLTSVISQISIGTSTSSSLFKVNSGFLYFPFVSTPVVTASAGDALVSLSWTTAVGALGWNVGGYSVGQSTVSGGPYTYVSVGNVLSSNRTSLANGTTYYFVVLPEDAFGNRIATSSQVSGTPVAAPPPAPPPSSGGGGGFVNPPTATVVFAGRAYPKSTVTILKDAQVAVTTIAGTDATFGATLSGLAGGNYIFSVYGEDYQGRRSSLLTFPVSVATGATVNVSGIFIAPSIAVDKSEVKKGDPIAIFGQSIPNGEILVTVNSHEDFFAKTPSDKDGIYLYNFDTAVLELGDHTTKSKASVEQLISGYSSAVGFKVGTKNVGAQPVKKCPPKGDVNGDCRVNLVDFSIAAFWWNRTLTPAAKLSVDDKLYPDGKITLRDFSIMAFYWTG